MLERLIELRERTVYHVAGSRPASYFIADAVAQGVLVNAPRFDSSLLRVLQAVSPLKYVFLPSRHGAIDLERWRDASGAETLATGPEAEAIAAPIDLVLTRGRKLTRTIDFLPMAGVTEGSCALRIRNNGGVLFLGPILEPGTDGWPVLVAHAGDHSFENRLLGALGLQDLRFEYAFTDRFEPGRTRIGPGAGAAIRARLDALIGDGR